MSISVITGLISMLSWGFADFIQSTVIRKIGTLKTMFLSNLISIILTLPFLLFTPLQISFSNFILIISASFFQVVSIYYFYESMKIGEISIVVPISASYPLITMLLFLLFGEVFKTLTIIATLILVTGIILVSTDIRKIKHIHTVLGVKQAVIALLIWGIYFFVLEIVTDNKVLFGITFPQTNYLTVFLYSYLAIGAAILTFTIIKKAVPTRKDLSKGKPLKIVSVTQIIYLISWLALNYGFAKGSASIVTPISSLYPAIAVILAIFFYKEKLVLNQKIGVITILVGLYLISI